MVDTSRWDKRNLAGPPPPGSGGGDNMEPRIAKVEADVSNIRDSLVELRSDLKHLLWASIAAAAALLIFLGIVYAKLDERSDAIQNTLGSIQVTLERVATVQEMQEQREAIRQQSQAVIPAPINGTKQ